MALDNPAYSRNEAFSKQGAVSTAQDMSAQDLQHLFEQPATLPDREVMTVENTVQKTVGAFAVLVVFAAIGWWVTPIAPFAYVGASIIGLVLAFVNIFKKEPSPGLILAYAAAQGVFVGGISWFFESAYQGIVAQAVIATLAVVGATLALFASGKVRASKKATKVFLVAMVGYLLYSLVSVVLSLFGAAPGPWGLDSLPVFGIPLGLLIGPIVILLGAYSLVLDFDFIQQAVRNRAPKKYGWTGAFGIMVTVIWLYLEILRFIGIARD
ncbi:Bax inhibitor-1/YccA family protein [Agromyces sp. MMS24-JH15]|uniref:Bax inhibitor-1/YccA family protein n=1 Tax=Agromyces sp. MMS24-JH15 TaxID=3243765 RepID=UPI00374805E6